MHSRETIPRGNTPRSGEISSETSRKTCKETGKSEKRMRGRSIEVPMVRGTLYTPANIWGPLCTLRGSTPSLLGATVLPSPSRYEPRYARLYRPYTMFLLWKGAREVTWKPSSRIERVAPKAWIYVFDNGTLDVDVPRKPRQNRFAQMNSEETRGNTKTRGRKLSSGVRIVLCYTFDRLCENKYM